jgi:hypothetical protein
MPIELVGPGRRPGDRAQDLEAGRLARPRGSHDGDELALAYDEVDASERRDLGFPHRKPLMHLVQLDQIGHYRTRSAGIRTTSPSTRPRSTTVWKPSL